MKYISTRGSIKPINFEEAVITGLADDGGLLIPEAIPTVDLTQLQGLSYNEIAFNIISTFYTEIDKSSLKNIIKTSYSNFDTPNIINLVNINSCNLAELFHGPTFAFKDIALQLLGNLFEHILSKRSEKINIIGATSGDTGSAAIYGIRGKKNIKIIILYPYKKVSPIQELQMTTVNDSNIYTIAVEATFDECQSIVKQLFADIDFKQKYHLGAINSINWARIMAQIVYYFYSYLQLGKNEKINFVVPTGNFGNILAGYYAKRMGLPIGNLVIATNTNNILDRLVRNGDYSIKDAVTTHSPSMDIQISSNLERFLYYLYDEDSGKLVKKMNQLKKYSRIDFDTDEIKKIKANFMSYSVNDNLIETTIKKTYMDSNYILDPHTACGVAACSKLNLDPEKTIVMATAHPAKFEDVIKKSININVKRPQSLENLELQQTKTCRMNNNYDEIKERIKAIIQE